MRRTEKREVLGKEESMVEHFFSNEEQREGERRQRRVKDWCLENGK